MEARRITRGELLFRIVAITEDEIIRQEVHVPGVDKLLLPYGDQVPVVYLQDFSCHVHRVRVRDREPEQPPIN